MIVVHLLLLMLILPAAWGMSNESRLFRHLFRERGSNYSIHIRPVLAPTKLINVTMTLEMLQIVLLDEKQEYMKASMWPTYSWHDDYLNWEPALFEDIRILRVPPSSAWNPDIVLMNNVDGKFEASYECNLLVHSTGEVQWMPPTITRSSCSMNVRHFPYDTQRCPMKFASVTYDESQLQISCQDRGVFFDPGAYSPSAEWHVVSSPCYCNRTSMPGTKAMYIAMICEFELRRLSLYYTINFVTPVVILTFLALLCFCLPSETNEKIPLCTSLLLSVTMLLMIIVKNFVPTTSFSLPLICQYLLFSMVMVSCSIISTVIVLNFHHKPPLSSLMPPWAHRFFLQTLAFKMGLISVKTPPVHAYASRVTSSGSSSGGGGGSGRSRDIVIENQLSQSLSCPEGLRRRTECAPLLKQSSVDERVEQPWEDRFLLPLTQLGFLDAAEVRRGTRALGFISHKYVKSDIKKRIRDEWHLMAKVLDRIFLAVYALVILVGSAAILLQAPNLRNDFVKAVKDFWGK